MNNKLRLIFFSFLLLLLLIASVIISLSIGSTKVNIKDIYYALSDRNSIEFDILIRTRLPRIILAIAIGGFLSISGSLLQAMFKNPLVEPYTLGISGGAGLGVSIAIFFRLNTIFPAFTLTTFAFIGSIITSLFLLFAKLKKGFFDVNRILLFGVMISFISSSLILIILSLSRTMDLHAIIFWMMGSLDEPDIYLIYLSLFLSIIVLFVSFLFSKKLNVLQLGDEETISLGINANSLKTKIFIIASLATSISVSVAGVIGFVGLVVPLFTKAVFGRDHRINLILTFFSGAIFLIICDTISRTIISPIELPVGVVTGVIGGIIFICILLNNKRFL